MSLPSSCLFVATLLPDHAMAGLVEGDENTVRIGCYESQRVRRARLVADSRRSRPELASFGANQRGDLGQRDPTSFGTNDKRCFDAFWQGGSLEAALHCGFNHARCEIRGIHALESSKEHATEADVPSSPFVRCDGGEPLRRR